MTINYPVVLDIVRKIYLLTTHNIFAGTILLAIGLGHPRFFHTDLSLVIQLLTLGIIAVSLFYKNRGKLKIHGITMGTAVILHALSFVLVMGPTFFNFFEFFSTETSIGAVQATWVHAVPGAAALLLGIFLIGRWVIHASNVGGCYKWKRIMDLTLMLWAFSLIVGITTYILFYL